MYKQSTKSVDLQVNVCANGLSFPHEVKRILRLHILLQTNGVRV